MKVQYIRICWVQPKVKFIELKTPEKPEINVLILQLKKLLKENQIKLKTTGEGEIISVREESNEVKINEIEIRKI